MKKTMLSICFAALCAAAPAAYADVARDELIRTEAEVRALNAADATAASPLNYQEAQLRLSEARVAEEKSNEEDAIWRAAEASLQASIVQEMIKLRALERTVSEIETGIAALRREIQS
jgi:hypothetical protein